MMQALSHFRRGHWAWSPMAWILAVLVISCSAPPPATRSFPPPPVTLAEARVMAVPVTVPAIGTVEPWTTVTVRPQISGKIVSVGFEEGQPVEPSDLLFSLDARPHEAALSEAQAQLDRDKTQLAFAESEVRRYAELVKKDFVTQLQYDDAVAAADALRASVKANEASVERARINVAYCTIRAPMSGRTGRILVQRGNVVKANDTALVTLHQIQPVAVSFSVPERFLSEIRRQSAVGPLSVTATLPPDEGPFSGTLSMIDNAVDQETGSIGLKARFSNDDQALWPGQFVNVQLILSNRQGAIVVPASAKQTSQDGNYIYVIAPDDTAEFRPITAGASVNGWVIVEQGVAAGERVVTDGHLRLYPGAKVVVKSEGTTTPGTEPQEPDPEKAID